MKLVLTVLALFLLAFAGLAAGLLLNRRGLKGGCQPAPGSDEKCTCKSLSASPNQSSHPCPSEKRL